MKLPPRGGGSTPAWGSNGAVAPPPKQKKRSLCFRTRKKTLRGKLFPKPNSSPGESLPIHSPTLPPPPNRGGYKPGKTDLWGGVWVFLACGTRSPLRASKPVCMEARCYKNLLPPPARKKFNNGLSRVRERRGREGGRREGLTAKSPSTPPHPVPQPNPNFPTSIPCFPSPSLRPLPSPLRLPLILDPDRKKYI